MFYVVTLNMPTKNSPVHQVFVEHSARNIADFIKALSMADFIEAEEYYLQKDHDTGKQYLDPQGPIMLNPMIIGKVKYYVER